MRDTGLVEWQFVAVLYAGGTASEVDLEGDVVGGEAHQFVGVGFVEDVVVLGAVRQFQVFCWDVRVRVDGKLEVVEGLFVSDDTQVDRFGRFVYH